VRWSRNSYRCYLTAAFKGWLWRVPAITKITVLQILLTPVTMGMTIAYLVFSRVELTEIGIIAPVLWLVLTRGIRGISHLRRHPQEILLLPVVVLVVIFIALPIKAFALVTMNKQGWLTRSANSLGGDGQTSTTLEAAASPAEPALGVPAGRAARSSTPRHVSRSPHDPRALPGPQPRRSNRHGSPAARSAAGARRGDGGFSCRHRGENRRDRRGGHRRGRRVRRGPGQRVRGGPYRGTPADRRRLDGGLHPLGLRHRRRTPGAAHGRDLHHRPARPGGALHPAGARRSGARCRAAGVRRLLPDLLAPGHRSRRDPAHPRRQRTVRPPRQHRRELRLDRLDRRRPGRRRR